MFLKTVFSSCCPRLNRPNFFNSLIFFPLVLWSVSSSTAMPQPTYCSPNQASSILIRPEEIFWKPSRPILVNNVCLFLGTSLLCISSVCYPALQTETLLSCFYVFWTMNCLFIAFQPIMYLPILPNFCFPCLHLWIWLKTLPMSQRCCSTSTHRRGEQISKVCLLGERLSM